MSKKIIFPLIAVLVAAFIYFSQSGGESVEQYSEKIELARTEKEEFMKTSSESPFKNSTSEFEGLNYFPPNMEYKVKAKIEHIETKAYMDLATSTGQSEKYLKYAYAKFELKGQEMKLLLLKKVSGGKKEPIFTAFADDSSGKSTYGGGRYLDLSFKNATRIELDFNLAYNPYCAYNDSFSCPFPPAENILPVSIEAGEKSYH
ncbi:DUF1684 domain-containing protein [Reichenbachiella sp. MALMAid0571]|uniref:DUF1684 domain-containing protein n=1 Tax=Reichenbachiella sp. MALMAid0571 TaxID=3143939 RepID=UPI0032DF8C4F